MEFMRLHLLAIQVRIVRSQPVFQGYRIPTEKDLPEADLLGVTDATPVPNAPANLCCIPANGKLVVLTRPQCAIIGYDKQAHGLSQRNFIPAQRQGCCSIWASPGLDGGAAFCFPGCSAGYHPTESWPEWGSGNRPRKTGRGGDGQAMKLVKCGVSLHSAMHIVFWPRKRFGP